MFIVTRSFCVEFFDVTKKDMIFIKIYFYKINLNYLEQ